MESPLLFPVTMEGAVIRVLDETRIPFSLEYLEVRSLEQALDVLYRMKTRSLGQVLLFFYTAVLCQKEISPRDLAGRFKEKRPTFDFFMLSAILTQARDRGVPLARAVTAFIERFDLMRKERARRLAGRLPAVSGIATICNVNGELIYLARELEKAGKTCTFYVCETRPYLQGSRLTFWELSLNDIKANLVCDSQIAQLMRAGKINCVVTGADRASTRGDIINKVGTYSLAVLARRFNIGFYALTQYPRDIDINSIEIEQRPAEESFLYLPGKYKASDSFYPAFDVTEAHLVTESLVMGGSSDGA